jgi:hypothetical protein
MAPKLGKALLVATSGARVACGWFRFVRNTATTFSVFYWLQVTNFDGLFRSAPNGANHFDVWDFSIHAQNGLPMIELFYIASDCFLPWLRLCGNRHFLTGRVTPLLLLGPRARASHAFEKYTHARNNPRRMD